MNGIEHLEFYATSPEGQVWYVAHPVHPTDDQVSEIRKKVREPVVGLSGFTVYQTDDEIRRMIVASNIRNAKAWLAWLSRRFPSITFIAPWIASIDGGGGDDLDPEKRRLGLRDCTRTIRLCCGIVLVGGRVSDGMNVECESSQGVIDLTSLGREPPGVQLTGNVVDQPPPIPRPDQIPVWVNVVDDFKARFKMAIDGFEDDKDKSAAWNAVNDMQDRDKIGRARYGTPLTTNNGRDHLVDAYQEKLDSAVYLKAAWLEGKQVRDVYYATLDAIFDIRMMLDADAAVRSQR